MYAELVTHRILTYRRWETLDSTTHLGYDAGLQVFAVFIHLTTASRRRDADAPFSADVKQTVGINPLSVEKELFSGDM